MCWAEDREDREDRTYKLPFLPWGGAGGRTGRTHNPSYVNDSGREALDRGGSGAGLVDY
jgi:hypothetical protein